MEVAEFSLKSQVEFYTDAIRASKTCDCAYNRNCGTFIYTLSIPFVKL